MPIRNADTRIGLNAEEMRIAMSELDTCAPRSLQKARLSPDRSLRSARDFCRGPAAQDVRFLVTTLLLPAVRRAPLVAMSCYFASLPGERR